MERVVASPTVPTVLVAVALGIATPVEVLPLTATVNVGPAVFPLVNAASTLFTKVQVFSVPPSLTVKVFTDELNV